MIVGMSASCAMRVALVTANGRIFAS